MKFLILGAGGIGSYFGARLINAGHEVIFVARAKQLEALQQNELKLHHPEFCFSKKVIAYTIDEIKSFDAHYFDAVLLTTKSTSTSFAVKPVVAFLLLQNLLHFQIQ